MLYPTEWKVSIMGGGTHQKIQQYSQTVQKLIQQGLEKRQNATKLIGSTRTNINGAKKLGINTARADQLLTASETKLKDAQELKEYDEIMKHLQNANKFVNVLKNQYNKANGVISTAKEMIADLSKKGFNVTQPQNLVQDAEKALTNNSYGTAAELADKSIKESEGLEAKFKTFENLMESINSEIADAKKTNANISEAEKLLEQITSLRKSGAYTQAITIAKQTKKAVITQKQNYLKASELIEKAITTINDAKNYEADTSEAEKLYNDATTKMEQNDYKTAIRLAQESIESAKDVKDNQINNFQQEAKQRISELEKKLLAAKKFGADIKKSTSILDEVKASMEKIDFKSTYDNIELCKNAITESLNQHQQALENIKSAQVVIAEAKEIGADITKAEEILSKAQQAIVNYDYETGKIQIILATEEAERARDQQRQLLSLQEQTEDILKTAKSTIKDAKDAGIIIAEAEELLAKAQGTMANSEYQETQEFAKAGIEKCKAVQELYTQAKETIQKAQTLISNSKLLMDTVDAEKIFGQSQARMDANEYSEALGLANDTIEYIEGIKINNKPIVTIKSPEVLTFKSGSWAKWQLEVSNEGKVHASEITFKTSEGIESRGFMEIKNLKAGSKMDLEIGLRTPEIGEIPVNVDISFKNPITDEGLNSREVLWIKTEPGEFGAQLPTTKVTGEAEAREPEGEVNVLSEFEFYQGFIRLKVGIKNEKNTVITDAKLDLEYDDNAIRLDHVEPALERRGNKILFGNIHAKEKRTVAFYLDPLICTESYIDGTLTYKDIYGELKTTAMKRRKAEVVCPIFHTAENINTAMLKRLINEELTIHDSKIYEIPYGLDFKKASKVCKDTIQSHDLKFVREFVESDTENYEIEAWYYGKTKVKKNEVVIKASTRKKTNTIELFVACKDKQVLTGFLAELGHDFNNKLKELGVSKTPIYPVTDTTTREEVIQTTTLLSNQVLDKNTLSLSKRGDEYEVGFKTPEEKGGAAEVFDFIKVSPGSRNDLIAQINDVVTLSNIFFCARGRVGIIDEEALNAEVEKELEKMGVGRGKKFNIEDQIQNLNSMGKLLYTMFLPVPIQKHLEGIKDPLILQTNDNEIPWELLHDDKEFLSLKVPIGRKLRSREVSRINPVKKRDRVKFLFIANPTGDLESAEEEVEFIKSSLGPEIDVDILKGGDATNASILSAFQSGNYDVIHYAGHAEFNLKSPDESALIGANNSKIFAQEIKRILGGKPFVFLNACGSGKEKICEDGSSYTGSDTEGLASSFIMGGALGLIGASWPTPDISAGLLASEFYKHFLAGERIGEALRKARIQFKKARPNDINWMAFILYGDPTLKLATNPVK